jgi:sarcosine oxidase subunit alpha
MEWMLECKLTKVKSMMHKELVIIGGGPSGLSAAIKAAEAGVKSLIIDRSHQLGGQLIKQTHMFFGSEEQYAKRRGIDIANELIEEISKQSEMVEVMINATVVGLYPDKVISVYQNEKYFKVKADRIIIAVGASEKVIAFPNNDLPGIYGAGAVQTLMNVYGVKPGNNVIMVGSGNIGLIVSYQLLQAGVNVLKVIEASHKIGGYKVHASKLRRYGVEIDTSTTIKRAIGVERLEAVELVKLNNKWEMIPDTEEIIKVDTLCLAVGLTPLHNLLSMIGCKMKYVNELGGLVPIIDDFYETNIAGVFACGDVVGIEEASSAILEGNLVGLFASKSLGKPHPMNDDLVAKLKRDLNTLRSGPFGEKIRNGLIKLGGHHELSL